VRWETLHLILTVGMSVKKETRRYREFHRMWLAQRQQMAEHQDPGLNTKKLSPHATVAVTEFRRMIRDLDEASVSQVMMWTRRAVQRQAQTETD
jgi:hypothetical protein